MSRIDRIVNLSAVFVPPLLLAAVIPFAWGHGLLGWSDVAIFTVLYLATGFGITIGYHRLMTHRSFATSKRTERVLAILGSLSVQGSPLDWVADHRKHHAHTDEEGDPHSPHAGHGSGIAGAFRGLFHAHVGWLWHNQGQADWKRYARDIYEEPGLVRISKRFEVLVLVTFVLPFAAGFALTGTLHGALTGLLWGGLVRVMALHHVTWSINSVCHFFGTRRFATDEHSTNVFWLALPSLGEAWHHNHHAFPRSAAHGLGRFELDPSAAVIRGMRRLGLAWDVVEITPERQLEREQQAGPAASRGSVPVADAA